MFKKIIKLLTNNLGLKIASILVAIILWLVVVNLDNPDKTVSYTIPVNVIHDDELTDMGKVYEIVNNSDVATIYVSGKRKLIDTMSASDFQATADLNHIDFQSTGDIKYIPITISANRHGDDLRIERKTVNMQITIEDLSTQRFSIYGNAQGIPAEGYAIGEISMVPNTIEVSGPRSLVSRIKRVAANINVEGATSDLRDSVVPVLYDENDQVIESPRLKLNQERVGVEVQMLGTKEVPIRCLTTGEPIDGFQCVDLKWAPESIMIKGVPSVLNGISEIVIPGEEMNLTGAVSDVENSIDITPYVEALNVMLLNSDENKIAVKAFVERLEVRSIDIPVSAIEQLNLDEAYRATFGVGSITVQIRGRSQEFTNFNEAGIAASIDLEGLEPGDHIVGVQVKVPAPYQVLGILNIQVHVADKEEEPEGENPDGENGEGSEGSEAGDTGSTGGSGNSSGGTGSTGGRNDSSAGSNGNNQNNNNNNEVAGNE